MKLYIPDIGDSITLDADWSFNLCNEHRNSGVWEAFKSIHPDMDKFVSDARDKIKAEEDAEIAQIHKENPHIIAVWRFSLSRDYYGEIQSVGYPVTLPKGTILKIDRIYIRKGVSDYSSITFNIASSPAPFLTLAKEGGTLPKGSKRRFWAKLHDVNTIEFRT